MFTVFPDSDVNIHEAGTPLSLILATPRLIQKPGAMYGRKRKSPDYAFKTCTYLNSLRRYHGTNRSQALEWLKS